MHFVQTFLFMRFVIIYIGETNDQNIRTTFIFHPAYMDYITKGSKEINYLDAADWIMPQNSFFDYLFNK